LKDAEINKLINIEGEKNMSGTSVIPKGNNERLAWALNFEQEFPALSAILGLVIRR